MKWVDISSFSKSDKVKEPKTFRGFAGKLVITVTRHIHYKPTDWVLSVDGLISDRVVSSGTAAEAKEAAISLIKNVLEEALACLSEPERN